MKKNFFKKVRYTKYVNRVNKGVLDFKDFVDTVYWENAHKDWWNVMAAKKIFLEDGGNPEKAIIDWDIEKPGEINLDMDF